MTGERERKEGNACPQPHDKNLSFVGNNIKVNQSIGTRHLAKSRHGQAICQLFEMKRFFLFIGNLAGCIEDTREKATRGGVIFTRARVSLPLLSLRKNGGLLAVYIHA